jgi:ADP-heptose:LPS heptosyltransferase
VFNGSRRERPTGRYGAVVAAVPPFYWPRYSSRYARHGACIRRPPDALFYEDEQAYYLAFASALGCAITDDIHYFLPIPPDQAHGVDLGTLLLAPGCKTGEMAAKRWPYYPELAEAFRDVVVVGTADDLHEAGGRPMRFPAHVRSMAGSLSLRDTAEVIAAAGVVVANDSGLGHLSGAVGTTTLLLFGPTPAHALGTFPPNVRVLRADFPCSPCWFTARLRACSGEIPCLRALSPDAVIAQVRPLLPCSRDPS